MWKRVLIGIFGLLIVTVISGYYYAPTYAKNYVHENYQGVTVNGAVDIDWGKRALTFHDVSVHRQGIEAQLTTVHATQDKVVTITGGTLDLDLDQLESKEGGGSGATITASDLVVKVKKGDATVSATKTKIDAQEVCFDTAAVHYKVDVKVEEGCLRRDKSEAWAKKATIPVKLPFDIPRMKRDYQVEVEGIRVHLPDQILQFDRAMLDKFEVDHGSIKLTDSVVFFDAASVKANHPWVAPYPVSFDQVGIVAPRTLLKGGEGNIRVNLGPTTVRIDPKTWTIEGEEPCNDWIEALPKPLPDALDQARGKFTGSLKFEVSAKPTPHLEIDYDCKFQCSAEPIASLRKGKIDYQAYNRYGELFTRTTGYQTPGWVSFAMLPQHVPEAFRLSEDPGFNSHKGIHVMALVNSLKANLESGSFVKGGSTITMQLAKNLWLKRHKTLGRKAMEALLTIGIESCISKPKIMELYLNVVEYGPDLYGLGPAAKFYFNKSAYDLAPDEAFYLAMLLPNPKKALPPGSGGLDRARRRMKRLATSGYISDLWVPEEDDAAPVDTSSWVFSD